MKLESKRIADLMNRIVLPLALLLFLPLFGLAAPFLFSENTLEATGTLSHLWSYGRGG